MKVERRQPTPAELGRITSPPGEPLLWDPRLLALPEGSVVRCSEHWQGGWSRLLLYAYQLGGGGVPYWVHERPPEATVAYEEEA